MSSYGLGITSGDTEDGGDTWTPLNAGFSVGGNSLIEISGVTAAGEVVAIIRQNDLETDPGAWKPSGQLALYRRLSLSERLLRDFGIAF